jgi:hypothetical protein
VRSAGPLKHGRSSRAQQIRVGCGSPGR